MSQKTVASLDVSQVVRPRLDRIMERMDERLGPDVALSGERNDHPAHGTG